MTLGGRSEASAYLKKEGLRLATKRAEEELKFLGLCLLCMHVNNE